MRERLRGVILAPRPDTQGAVPRIAAWLADELNRDGWSVEVWPWGKRGDDESVPVKLMARSQDVRDVAARLKSHHPDFVVIKSGLDWKSVLRDLALTRAIRTTVPTVILHPHGSQTQRLEARGHRLFKRAVTALLAKVDAVFVLSTEERELLEQFRPGLRVHVVDNPYDRASLGSTERVHEAGRFRVLFAGRLVAEKGVLELVRASADLDGRGALEIVFLGDGPVRDQAAALAISLGVSEHVRFLGVAPREVLADAYRHADVLALPSYSEGFPTVVTEAMSFGLPIVCTRIRGLEDHLVEGVNALFVGIGDADDLRTKLLMLRDDDALVSRMADANRLLVRKFDPPAAATRYRAAIEDVLG